MVLAFDHFKAYLLNTQKSVIVFTDARALMWVGRNREYSIACNGLVNKLAKIQLEIPHVVYSVPSEVNYLADIFSRAFTTSRFLDKSEFALSKAQANKLPALTDPFVATESVLYQYYWKKDSEKAQFGLGYKIRSHGTGKRRMRRPLSAFTVSVPIYFFPT